MASSVLASTLAALCAVTSLTPPAPSLSEALVQFAAEGDYAGALERIDLANMEVNKDPEASVGQLEAAVAELSSYGVELANDPKGRENLELSRLNLARALLIIKDEDKASAVMDATLIAAHGRQLPIKRFGPKLAKFAARRLETLEAFGQGSVEVECLMDCRVIIDEEVMDTSSGPMFLGKHRVWIESIDGSVATESHAIRLDEAGQVVALTFPEAGLPEVEEEPIPDCAPVAAPAPPPPPPKRILPRWASISVAIIGASAAVAGGVMLGLDGKCPGGLDPIADAPECPTLYEGTVPGLVAIGIGSALLITGAVVVSVDEVRIGKQKGRQATIGWQMRF